MIGALLLAAGAAGVTVPPCRFVIRPIGTGGAVTAADTVEGSCSGRPPARRLRYDARAKVARAAVDLASGDELGRVFLSDRPGVLPGDSIVLTATIGPVAVAKSVTALQPGYPGGRLFVRDEAGQVFSAPYPGEARP